MVLGTAQDGGLPQLGGTAPEDEAARRDPARRRLVASMLIVDPASGALLHIPAAEYAIATRAIDAAVEAAQAAGGEIAHPPMEIPGHGMFAIFIQGGIHHGLWQV